MQSVAIALHWYCLMISCCFCGAFLVSLRCWQTVTISSFHQIFQLECNMEPPATWMAPPNPMSQHTSNKQQEHAVF
jgi:hypothetical protein